MKLILLTDESLRLEPTPGPLTIEALTAEQAYSPFHMMASGLAYCTFSVMYAWAEHAQLDANDLALEVAWTFADDPHRVDSYDIAFEWPSLPAKRREAARRVAEMCTVHATLQHPPRIEIRPRDSSVVRGPSSTDHGPRTMDHEAATTDHGPAATDDAPDVARFTIAGEDATRGLGRPYTCVYDGTCKVCTRLAHVLRAWDRHEQIEIVPSQAPGVTARFPWIPARAYAEALQLIGPNGHTWQGAAAIEQLLEILPKGRLISWIFKIPFVRGVADRFYKWFARNRYRLGCGEHCQSRPLDVAFRES